MFKLSNEDDGTSANLVVDVLSQNFDKLPNVRNELLLKLADNWLTASTRLPDILASNFVKLPMEVQRLLFKLADKKTVHVPFAIVNNYDKLPDNISNKLIFELAHGKRSVWGVVDAVASNYKRLPENVRDLLFKLADNKGTVLAVARSVHNQFDSLPNDVRNELLLKSSTDSVNLIT